jgi:hypothetical protein
VFGASPAAGAVSLAAPGAPPRVAYAAAHTVVVHDGASGRQAFLQVGVGRQIRAASQARSRRGRRPHTHATTQPRPLLTRPIRQGHRNPVTCLDAPADRAFLVSADAGPAPLVVAWDPAGGQPLWTLAVREPGVAAAALSADGRLLATLSAAAGPGVAPGANDDGAAGEASVAQEVGGHG